ncbi:hypothetical protein DN068_21355 [Taibaiella soli]|uniref:Cytochrome c domain-containing protein n=2 Tax=Taibaiella soli TaxID=1649169 RepID=A0A2W2AS39_9BACT|nr:hypothetical protein DN068_21355 [Taibaiella soli]
MACKHDLPKPAGSLNTDTTTQVVPDTGICFERDILPVFITYCTRSGCHDAQTQPDGYNFTSYETIIAKGIVTGDAKASLIYKDIANGSMPWYPNPQLSSEQKALIARWINEGAKNGTNCTLVCDSNNISYTMGVKPLIATYCVGCHNAHTNSGNVALDNYSGVQTVALDGRLLNVTMHLQGYLIMPPTGAGLSDCQITQLKKWVAAGAPNN